MTTSTITAAGSTRSTTYTLSSSATTAFNLGTVTTSVAVRMTGSNDTLDNLGVIIGGAGSAGALGAIYVKTGTADVVLNEVGGVIRSTRSNTSGIIFVGRAGTVVNYGSIGVAGLGAENGVELSAGGLVSNKSSGTITGGVDIFNATGTVVNAGTLLGDANYGGVYLSAGGAVTNLAGGVISNGGGAYGIKVLTGGTVTNSGTITAGTSTGAAIIFQGSFTNRLILDPGEVIIGTVDGGTPSQSTLELGSGAASGTISNLGSFGNFGTLAFDSGAAWNVYGSPTRFHSSVINGFVSGDTIRLQGNETISSFGVSSGVTNVTLTGATPAILYFAGTITNFQTVASGGVTSLTTICFCKGTQILTPEGEVGVETLAVGDLVVTKGGKHRPVVWIGKGKVLATRGQRGPATPVIVRKGALGPNVPNRDLHVTKAHSLYFDGVFVPVEFLVNHRSIVWDDRAQEVEIYHVELESHDILIANGAPAESYRDDGNRWLFQNSNDGWNGAPQEPYAPVLTGGLVVDLIWERLLDRAGPRKPLAMTDDADLHLVVDGIRLGVSEIAGNSRVFFIPGTPSAVTIASRDVVPVEWGIARDSRALGVAVRKIELHRGDAYVAVAADDPRLADGFHDYEAEEGIRWTNGRATLSPEVLAVPGRGALKLVLTLGGATRYPDLGAVVAAA